MPACASPANRTPSYRVQLAQLLKVALTVATVVTGPTVIHTSRSVTASRLDPKDSPGASWEADLPLYSDDEPCLGIPCSLVVIGRTRKKRQR